MKVHELEITLGDLAKAQHEYAESGDICVSCLVFQAAKRAGLNPVNCGYVALVTNSATYLLSAAALNIVRKTAQDWPSFVGTKFTLTEAA